MSLSKPRLNEIEEEIFVFPASFAQQRLWFLEQLIPNSSLYNTPLLFRLVGSLNQTALEQSINAIANRHESLQTTFDVINGQLVQAISTGLSIVSLDPIDLSTLPPSARESVALGQIRQETQAPFNLSRGPLWRVRLWRLDETDHLLLLLLHHIIFDEWSSGVLIRELGVLYTGFANHQPSALSELPIQYADFAHWQREWLQGDLLTTQLGYWRRQLQDVSVLNLAAAFARPAVQTYQGSSQLLELPQSLLIALEELSQQAGVTLFMTLLAAFQTVLHRYTGQIDVAVGSPIANRHRSELEGLIGFLVNSLVLRTDLGGDPSFGELLERVRETTLAAYAHQDLPFEKLVEELQPVRSLGQNPLFQVVFALQNTPMTQLELPGLTLSPVEFEAKTARFNLELYLWKCAGDFRSLWGKGWQQADGLRGIVVYKTDLFEATEIAALCRHFQTLLEGIVANPQARLSALPLLTSEEHQRLLVDWNATQTDYPAQCIHPIFEAQVQQTPAAIALQFGDCTFTYQDLNQGSNQLAHYLKKLGIWAEQRVGICLERSAEAIATMLAVLKAGGAYVPLDPSHPPERLRFVLEDAEISVVVTRQSWATLFAGESVKVVCLDQAWDAIAQESEENLPCTGTGEQLAYVMYTSGSTGTPKGVMVPHRAVNRLVCATNYVQIERCDRVAQVANLAFDAATFEVWGALLNGAQLIGLERQVTLDPARFAAVLAQQQISVMFLTTALFNQTVSQVPHAFRSLKYVLFGGELANPDRVRQVLNQGKPKHLIHVYGPTENTTFSTRYEVETVPEKATRIPIGRPIANTQVYLLDAHLNPVPIGIIGEIYLGGAGLAIGYLNRPELTAERFVPNPFGSKTDGPNMLYRTGDRACYDAEGNLQFLGRTDHQVKLRGFRVELGEIEAVLAQHPMVQAATVVVREVECDRQLVAYVVPVLADDLSEADLRGFLKTKLPVYMLPAAFVSLSALPLTANGKVDQRALPPPSLTRSATRAIVAPKTSLEKSLAEIWGQLLGCEQVGVYDNFFDLGGHSLLATQLVSRLRDTLQVELPLKTVFETPTIAGLVQHLEAMRWVTTGAIAVSSNDSRLPVREEIEL